jgi:lipopolysaccharide/colanic/teichoic acid biosynthesis glycosyltransferase
MSSLRADLLWKAWLEISSVTRGAAIRAMALKGGLLALHLYGDLTARGSGDLDILVQGDQFEHALSLLGQLGYRGEDVKAGLAGGAMMENQVACVRGPVTVDLHWLPLGESIDSHWKTEALSCALWDSAHACPDGYLRPSEPVLLTYLALHSYFHTRRLLLRDVTDAAAIVSKGWSSGEWASLFRCAVDVHATVPVALLLKAAKDDLGADVPDGVLDGLAPSHASRWLLSVANGHRSPGMPGILTRVLRWAAAGGMCGGKTHLLRQPLTRLAVGRRVLSSRRIRRSAKLSSSVGLAATKGCIGPLVKRALDVVGASFLLLLLGPALAVIALAIRLDSGDPILFRQKRVGRNGLVFELVKFRTLLTDAPRYQRKDETLAAFATPVGRFLRRTSLDELPQLINVLRGEMSLVGPRPEMPFIAAHYSETERLRLVARPGITGLWQLDGDHTAPIHHRLDLDLQYIRRSSLWLDLSLLLRTVGFLCQSLAETRNF